MAHDHVLKTALCDTVNEKAYFLHKCDQKTGNEKRGTG